MENKMKNLVKGINLVWIVVKDIKDAIKFYTDTVGFTLHEFHEQYGWAELSGPSGSRIGLAQENKEYHMQAGTNAVVAITVENIEEVIQEFKKKGVKLIGDVMEVPGEVKLQTFEDHSGNKFQLAQILRK